MTARPRRSPPRVAGASSALLLVAGFLITTAGAAFAFWTVNVLLAPTNHALAQADALSAPTSATATADGSSAITVSWSEPSAQLPGAQYQVTRTTGPGSPVTVCTVASSTTSCEDTALTGGTAYDYKVTAVLASWRSPAATASASTAKAAQSITFSSTAPSSATVGGATYAVAATASSGLPVAFTIDPTSSSVCSIAGSTVSFSAVGTCIVNADQGGNASYLPAPRVQQSFTVGKGSQTISFTSTAPASAAVGGTTYTASATATSGLAVTISSATASTCTVAGSTVSFVGAGTCTLNADQAGNASYDAALRVQQSFTVGKGSQTITFTSTAPPGATFGGATYTAVAAASSGLPVTITSATPSTCGISGSTVSFVGAGTCTLRADQDGNSSYNPAPQALQSFPVAKASQSITFTSAPPGNPVPGGATYTATATATSGLAVTITSATPSICTVSGSTVSFVTAGTCTLNANQAGNANYHPAPQVQQTFAVGALTITGFTPSGNSANPRVEFTGTGGTAGSTVTVTVCRVNAFPCTLANSVGTVTAAVPSSGSWTTSKLTVGLGSFYAQATQDTPAKTSAVFSFTTV